MAQAESEKSCVTQGLAPSAGSGLPLLLLCARLVGRTGSLGGSLAWPQVWGEAGGEEGLSAAASAPVS